MFRLEVSKLNWINDNGADDPCDLCAHGNVIITIGEKSLTAQQITASAGAIFLLRSITEDHIALPSDSREAVRILPCCGNGIYEDENDPDRAVIITCPFGFDFSVIHEDGNVKISCDDCGEVTVTIDDYRREVYAFADAVMAFYEASAPKKFENPEYEKGYLAMMREWNKLRNA